jgi:uncharacterized protein (TIGR00661 family)
MAKVAISLSGDGRGHATRVRALVERLREDHAVTIYTSGDAYSMLGPAYANSEVRVLRLECLRFGYDRDGKVRLGATLAGAASYLRRFPGLVSELAGSLSRDMPDLVISDFEPALPRAAARLGIPHISINHQHFLLTYDLRSLPAWLRVHASYMGLVVRLYDAPAVARVVSSFYFPPLKLGCGNVTQTGVLLRPQVLDAEVSNRGGHIVAYWRRQAPQGAMDALRGLDCEVRVYGLGARRAEGNLRFFAADEAGFVSDLASSRALVCTAGNQLVGEAIFLRKPVFAIPEPGNYEQYINAYFVARMGAGEWAAPGRFGVERLRAFLDSGDSFGSDLALARADGLPRALAVVRRQLMGVRRLSVAKDPVVV